MVRRYFQKTARQFDQLYEQNNRLSFRINRWLRGPMYRRFALTMRECDPAEGKTVLDVGCGSGRYAVALAERGALVTGIDFAESMLSLAQQLAAAHGVSAACHWIQADFLEWQCTGRFDISLAIGLFDYIADPLPYLAKMHQLSGQKVIFSFPKPGGWRSTQRRIRYRIRHCPLYFHTQASMTRCLQAAGFQSWRFDGSWAVAYV